MKFPLVLAMLSMPEILAIFAVLLLLFGATRLPQLGSSLGSAIRNFKKGFAEETPEEKAKPEGKNVVSLSPGGATDHAQDAQKEKAG